MAVRIEHGDCLTVMRALIDAGVRVQSVVTDPPYHLTSIVKRFGKPGSAAAKHGADGAFTRASRGFMGKEWDGGDVAFRPETWRLCFDLLPPGGHLVAFSGTRTYHRMACAIEDAGFEIRDMIGWLYGSGFPKSHNQHGDWEGWGTALKPAQEPICMARKPLDGTVSGNVQKYGIGAINVDGCRVGEREKSDSPLGRWPANIVHDGSAEVLAAFPLSNGQQGDLNATGRARPTKTAYGNMPPPKSHVARFDTGSAARFFYTAKADADDRLGSKHPTVKPLDLMRWLVRLVTPPGGTILDPFAGTGSTGIAALREGFDAIMIEREAEYVADIRERVAQATDPNARPRAAAKTRNVDPAKKRGDDTPLFGGGS